MGITYEKVGAGIVTGGMTTAIAFLTLTTGRSSGIVEFGLVTGVSVIVVMLATLLILPTFLILREKISRKSKKKIRLWTFLISHWAKSVERFMKNINSLLYQYYLSLLCSDFLWVKCNSIIIT